MSANLAKWVDTHLHLTDEAYKDDLHEVIRRAKSAGVGRFISNSSDRASIQDVLFLAGRLPEVYCTVGIHPSDCEQLTDECLALIRHLAAQAAKLKIVAIGEIGLDYHYDGIDKEQQKRAFRRQLEVAAEFDLPVVIHDRDAHEDILNLLLEAEADGLISERPGVFHCYSGSKEFALRLLEMGWFFGFDGPLTFKNGRKARETVLALPKDRILIETDSPYLAPHPYRGKRNEPSYLPLIGEALAELWEMSPEETAAQLYENAIRLFPEVQSPIDA